MSKPAAEYSDKIALSKLRHRLLDLSNKNSFINHKDPFSIKVPSLAFVNFDAYFVLAELLKGTTFTIKDVEDPIKDASGKESHTLDSWLIDKYTEICKESNAEYAGADFLQTYELSSSFSLKVSKLIKKSKQAIEETGVNSLFLVFGVLAYKSTKDLAQELRAPLINVPIELTRKDGTMTWEVCYTGAPLVENFSVKEKLKQEYNLDLPNLPDIDEISDVVGYLEAVKSVVSLNSWSIFDHLFLTSMSPLNMLLFNDLREENWETKGRSLLEVPAIAEILSEKTHQLTEDLYQYELDSIDVSTPDYPCLIEEADGSQLNAILNVLNTQDNQVIIGPPGTGKSQTITNLISSLLMKDKKVLFISEKQAALEVVHQRLMRAGLGAFVVSLHNNKANKKDVISSLVGSLDATCSVIKNPVNLQELEENRQTLARYCYELNAAEKNENSKASVHQLIWRQKYLESINSLELTEVEKANFDSMAFIENKEKLTDLFKKAQFCSEHVGTWGPHNKFSILKGSSFKPFYLTEYLAELEQLHAKFKLVAHSMEELKPITIKSYATHELRKVSFSLEKLLKKAIDVDPAYYATIKSKDNLQKNAYALEKITEFNLLTIEEQSILNNLASIGVTQAQALASLNVQDLITNLLKVFKGSELSFEDIAKLNTLTSQQWDSLVQALDGFDIKAVAGQQTQIKELLLQLKAAGADYFDIRYISKKYKNLCIDILQLKKEINTKESESALDLPKEEKDLEAFVKNAYSLMALADSALKWIRPSWFKILATHKQLQKNKALSYKLTDKENNLIGLYSIFEKYIKLKKMLEGLPENLKLVEDHVLFNAYNFEESLKLLEVAYAELKSAFLLFEPQDISPSNFETILNKLNYFVKLDQSTQDCLNVFKNQGLEYKDLLSARNLIKDVNDLKNFCVTHLGCSSEISFNKLSTAVDLANQLKNVHSKISQDTAFANLFLTRENVLRCLSTFEFFNDIDLDENFGTSASEFLAKAHSSYALVDQLNNFKALDCALIEQLDQLDQEIYKINCHFEFHIDCPNLRTPALFEENFQKITFVINNLAGVKHWIDLSCVKKEILKVMPLNFVFERVSSGVCSYSEMFDCLEKSALLTHTNNVILTDEVLMDSVGATQELVRTSHNKNDATRLLDNRDLLKNHLIECRTIPKGSSGARVKDYSDLVLIKHLKKTPGARLSLREIFINAGAAIQELAPCFLMGPHAVAQYLDVGNFKFDVLIIDEASQMKLEHSLGAIARASQIVIVGDPEQLGPSSSFQANAITEDEPWAILESESILTWAANKYKESVLSWHYRSKHESLIDFSNKTFYKNQLVVVPSAEEKNATLGLNYHYLPKALYNDRTNEEEIRKIVEKIIDHVNKRAYESLGVVALNLFQAEQIEMELEKRMPTEPKLLHFLDHWSTKKEPFFIKNLENVQGDERDVILVSLTFGKPLSGGPVNQNFGLISRSDGGRRLNVLITRAKKCMHVFSSLQSTEVREEPKTPRGTVVFKRFLEHCELDGNTGTNYSGTPESPFEKVICDILDKNSYQYSCQFGVAGYRIDIVVKSPYGHGFIAAIECDGASYHSAACVKDRDKVRQKVLEERGWAGKIYRIWSTDWFKNKEAETKKLLAFLAEQEAVEAG